MSHETNASRRSVRWSRRRALGVTLGLAVVVGSGVAANASANGDGFFKKSATGYGTGHLTAAAPMQSTAPTGMQDMREMHGMTGMTGMPTDAQHMGARTWGNGWTWNGAGMNRWAFHTLVDQTDPTFNQALGINDRGQVVGYFGSGKDAMHPNRGWSATAGGRGFRDIDFPGAAQTQAVGVNDDGVVVGFYVENDGSNHGFMRRQGRYVAVDAPWTTSKPSFNQLLGISRNGIAAGFYNDAMGNAHGYLFNTRTRAFMPVRTPWRTATSVTVTGVNDDGVVVGFAVVNKKTVAFVITRHTALLVSLGNGMNTQILGINRAGVAVGSFEGRDGRTHGFTWMRGQTHTVDAPHAKNTVVNGVNGAGQIVGFFEDGMGATKGFVARH